jgi:hypothetical protein
MASADAWHIDKPVTFTGDGGPVTFSSNVTTTCTSTTVNGAYETTTAGWIEYTFHGCIGPFKGLCATAGQPPGTITTTKLSIHNVILGW